MADIVEGKDISEVKENASDALKKARVDLADTIRGRKLNHQSEYEIEDDMPKSVFTPKRFRNKRKNVKLSKSKTNSKRIKKSSVF